MNRVDLIGRMVADPEVRYTSGNDPMAVCKFTLAVSRKARDKSDFIPCVAFRMVAELMEKYVHKGDRIGISGHIQTGSYENKEGRRIYTVEVITDDLYFLETKRKQDDIPAGYQAMEDDMPF